MSLPSSFVGFFRTMRADRYVDSCTVERTTARGTYNPTTLQYDSPTEPNLYTGGCLIRSTGAEDIDFGEQDQHRGQFAVYFPFDTDGLRVEDRITVTAVHPDGDQDLVGQVLVVTAVPPDSYETTRMVSADLDQGRGTP